MGDWWLYLLSCRDGSLYCGITADVTRRVREHNFGKSGARYTRGRRPVRLVYQELVGGRSAALRREAEVKRMTTAQKRALFEEK